jgi:hypothetical protein
MKETRKERKQRKIKRGGKKYKVDRTIRRRDGIKRHKKQGKTKKMKKVNIQKGGTTLHYIISSHGSTEGVRDYTREYPGMILYSYVENWGDILPIICGYDLQTFLTSHRLTGDKKYNHAAVPTCTPQKPPHINSSIFNAKLYVMSSDTWISGILDVTDTSEGGKRVIETWTAESSSIEEGYTLNDALATIYTDVRNNYGSDPHNIKVHILTCL